MIQQLSINPGSIKGYSRMTLNASGSLNAFPFLLIDQDSYIVERDSTPENLRALECIFEKYQQRDCDIILQTGESCDEHVLFQHADAYITTRSQETVYRTCLADLYQVNIIYGTDEPLFHV